MGLIDKIVYALRPGERRLKEVAEDVYNMMWRYQYFPNDMSRHLREGGNVGKIAEVDDRYLDLMSRLSSEEILLQYGSDGDSPLLDKARQNAVKLSRELYRNDVTWGQMVHLWSCFGFGERIDIVPRNAEARATWEEFLTADRNQPVLKQRYLHRLSDRLLVDGELFFVYFVSTLDGDVTLRTFDPLTITKIITDPDDQEVPLLYERTWSSRVYGAQTKYYRDYMATEEQINNARRVDETIPPNREIAGDDNTAISVFHVPHQTLDQRGWPLLYAGLPWVYIYRDFLQDRAAVTKIVASRVDKIKYKGGQRALEALQQTLQSTLVSNRSGRERNPVPIAGSVYLENQQSNREAMPLTTGASDASTDGASFIAQVGLAGGIFPHWLGRGESFRLATAEAMEPATIRQFNAYQTFWNDVERDMVLFVLREKEEYSGATFPDKSIDVTTDSMLDIGIREKSRALNNFYENGLIPFPIAQRLALESLGVKDIGGIIEPSDFEPEPENNTEELPMGDQ